MATAPSHFVGQLDIVFSFTVPLGRRGRNARNITGEGSDCSSRTVSLLLPLLRQLAADHDIGWLL